VKRMGIESYPMRDLWARNGAPSAEPQPHNSHVPGSGTKPRLPKYAVPLSVQ